MLPAARNGRRRTGRSAEIRGTGDPGIGQHHDLVDRGVDGVEELDAQVLSMVLVPSAGDAIFRVGFFLEANVRIHRRLRSSASARCRTSDQRYRPIHRRSRGGPVARFQPPRQLRLQQDYLLRQRRGWPTIPRRCRRVRGSAMSALRAEVPRLARPCLILHPSGWWPLAK
jgi:hypothetical protein